MSNEKQNEHGTDTADALPGFTAPPTTHDHPFDHDQFIAAKKEIARLVVEEWPQVPVSQLDAIEGDPDQVLRLVIQHTGHSKALVRKHLAEIAEVAGVGARGFEQRLLRLLHLLEDRAEPVQERLDHARDKMQAVASSAEENGKRIANEVTKSVDRAEVTLKNNLWLSLLTTLGIGVLIGLITGLSRDR